MKSFFTAAAVFATLAAGQTWSACNPMNVTCPPNVALGTNHTFDLTKKSAGQVWNVTSGSIDYTGNTGGKFIINKKGDSPTFQSEFYIFFGEIHVNMQAAKGQGIISSIVLESDDLDEVDWEITGTNNTVLLGQPTTTVETNYFGKGNTTSYDRAAYYPVNDPTGSFHKYSVIWTSDKIDWLIDDQLVRTLPYAAANGGYNFPQTPMNVRIGIWAGGDPDNEKGVIEWAGGETNFDDGPFTMTVASIDVHDYSQGSKEYLWTDKSGSFQSIKAVQGNSTAANEINKAPTPTMAERWNSMSTGAHAGIIAGACAGGAALLGAFAFAVWKRRRAGKKEHEIQERKFDQDNLDIIQQQQQFRSDHPTFYADNRSAYSQDSVQTQYNTRGQPTAPVSSPLASRGFSNSPNVTAYNNPSSGYVQPQTYTQNFSNPGVNPGQGGGFRGGQYNNGYGGAGGNNGGYYNGHY